MIALCFTLSAHSHAAGKNGFDLENSSIPLKEIHLGGPPRDGIPALILPKFIKLNAADYLDGEDRVLGVVINGVARIYPIKILNHHEIVNDRIDSQHFVVSYCPLCGTGMVFASNLGKDNALIFGVSGLLYNSDVLLYDRNTESLWSQIMGEAITGKFKGTKLPMMSVLHTTLADWTEKHPESEVMSEDTGYNINYEKNPYGGYENSRRLWFSVSDKAPREFHPKQQILGVELNGTFKAYSFSELDKLGSELFADEVAGTKIEIHWNSNANSAYITNAERQVIPSVIAYWFAWYTFHPETLVFKAQ